jgi:hypothetical protein
MPAGKSANKHHALEEWKAKMRGILRVFTLFYRVRNGWPLRAVRRSTKLEPPTITMRLIQQKFNWNVVLVQVYEPKYRQWIIPATHPSLHSVLSCDTEGILSATTYVRNYYTGGRRAIGEIK